MINPITMRKAAADLKVMAMPGRHVSPAVISAGILRIAEEIEAWAEKAGQDRVKLRDICVALQNAAASGRGLSREACTALASDIDGVIWAGKEAAQGADVIPLRAHRPPTMADALAEMRGVFSRGPRRCAMSMRAALVEAREYIANDLAEIIDNSSIDYTRANISENALPYVEKAEGIIAKIDAALSEPPTNAECAAALNAWFADFGPESRSQFLADAYLVERMRRGLIASRDVEHVG